MVILLESSKITTQVTNHFRYMEAATYGGLNLFFQPISTYFLFTGILITSTGIFNKNPTGTGCDPPPPQPLHDPRRSQSTD